MPATRGHGSQQPDDERRVIEFRSNNQATVSEDHKDEDDRSEYNAGNAVNQDTGSGQELLTAMQAAVDLCKKYRDKGQSQYRDIIVGVIDRRIVDGSFAWDKESTVVPLEDRRVLEEFVRQCHFYYRRASDQYEKINAVLSSFVNKVRYLGEGCVRVEVDISHDALSYLLSSLNYVTKQLKSDLLPSKDEMNELIKETDPEYKQCLLDMLSAVAKHIRIHITISKSDMLDMLQDKRGKLNMHVMAKLESGSKKGFEDEKMLKEEFVAEFHGFQHVKRALNILFFPQPLQAKKFVEGGGADEAEEDLQDMVNKLVKESETGNTDAVEHLLGKCLGKFDITQKRDSAFHRTPLHYAKNKEITQMVIDSVDPPKRADFLLAKDGNIKTALENAEDENRAIVAEYLRKLPPIIRILKEN